MKFMMRFFVICILSLIQITFAVQVRYEVGTDYYVCAPQDLEIKIPGTLITEFTGQHKPGKEDSDVSVFYIADQKTDYLPRGMATKYVNIESLNAFNTGLKAIARDDFKEMPKLKELTLFNNKIEIIPSNCFDDLAQLERLYLSNNKIRTLPNEIFHALPELKQIELSENLFTVVPAYLFESNLKLEDISFSENKLKFIDGNILTNLKNLKRVDFLKNSCINSMFPDTSLDSLVQIIKSKCNVNLCTSVDKDIEKLQILNKNLQKQQKAYTIEKNTLRANCPEVFTPGYPGTQSLLGNTNLDDLQQKYDELKISCDKKPSPCASKTELVFRHKS